VSVVCNVGQQELPLLLLLLLLLVAGACRAAARMAVIDEPGCNEDGGDSAGPQTHKSDKVDTNT